MSYFAEGQGICTPCNPHLMAYVIFGAYLLLISLWGLEVVYCFESLLLAKYQDQLCLELGN